MALMSSYEAIKDLHEERRTFGQRAAIAALLGLLGIFLLAFRLTQLQIVEHEYFSTRSDDNRMRVLPVAPVRGLIYDRNGLLLAQNLPSFEISITPEQIGNAANLSDTLSRLAKLIKLTDADIVRFKDRVHKSPRYRPVLLRSNLTAEEVARYELNRYDFTGVDVNAGLVRDYPLGEATAHVIGYVGGITEADYANITEADYQGLNQIGRSGIERSHEDDLRGNPGARIVEANAAGRPLRELDQRPGVGGRNLVLSIDAKLQTIAEKALGELDGAAVAIDPRNGEILALVSKPGFDPSPFVEGIDSPTYKSLLDDPDRPLYNRALLGTYPPGSTIKPFMALAGLNYGNLTPQTHLNCSGTFYLQNSTHKYRCWQRHGHGTLDMETAIAKSCDIYFYQVATSIGIDHIGELLGQFGLGQPTGIDIPSEKSGLLPSRAWKTRVHHQAWFPGETLNVGIGQGYWQVTPLQLAQITARMAMRGAGYTPHLIHAYADAPGGQLSGFEPTQLPPINVRDQGIFDRVIKAMQLVTQQPGGTAYAVFKDAPYTSAGKTGTAQVAGLSQEDIVAPKQDTLPVRLRDHAIFIAFAPVENPMIAVAVIAEHGGHGGSVAAPVARQLMDQWITGKVSYSADKAAAAAAAAAAQPPAAPAAAPDVEVPAPEDADTPPVDDSEAR